MRRSCGRSGTGRSCTRRSRRRSLRGARRRARAPFGLPHMPSERKFGGMRFSIIQVAIVVGVCAPVLGAQGTTPGFYVETRVTTVSKGGSGNATTRTHVTRAWSSATCSRTEGEGYRGDLTAYQLLRRTPPTFLEVVPR